MPGFGNLKVGVLAGHDVRDVSGERPGKVVVPCRHGNVGAAVAVLVAVEIALAWGAEVALVRRGSLLADAVVATVRRVPLQEPAGESLLLAGTWRWEGIRDVVLLARGVLVNLLLLKVRRAMVLGLKVRRAVMLKVRKTVRLRLKVLRPVVLGLKVRMAMVVLWLGLSDGAGR